ncbi:MAG: M20/M25/M40 family metallo-hydrolase [Clostridia bacterium]|nr:M20/M25/M40 family metallo-hydrolase [Clostridia bacterium]MBR6186366.1 M20/M25/M40 family metallo-hydrolase [Clostridia bacterium]
MIVLWIVLGIIVALLLIALVRALLAPKKTASYQAPKADQRAEEYARKLSRMVAFDTVSVPETNQREKFLPFHALLAELFPLVHEKLEKTEIDGNLLFHWKGKRADRPLVLMSHQDVVPAEGEWLHGPFSGDIADGKVWGRGASDTKCSVMAFFQAAEELLKEGYIPENDVYLSSSCTEEWAGDGCPKLVEYLEKQGVRPFLVCDEGGGIITDPVGGIKGNFAMVGVFEKGKADVRLTAKSTGGHASAPGKHTPVARLSDFVGEFEHHSPFKRKMSREVQALFEQLAPYAPFYMKLLFCNMWLFRPLLIRALPMISAQAGAMLQTTIAFTMLKGSDAYNVLPQEAVLGANMRFIPHQGMEQSLEILRRIAKKHQIDAEVFHAVDASRSVDIHGEGFSLVQRVIGQTFAGLETCPYVMTGATDARNYERIAEHVVRFAPVIYGPEQMKGMHGLNENIEYNCLPGAVDFYKHLIAANNG